MELRSADQPQLTRDQAHALRTAAGILERVAVPNAHLQVSVGAGQIDIMIIDIPAYGYPATTFADESRRIEICQTLATAIGTTTAKHHHADGTWLAAHGHQGVSPASLMGPF